MSVAVFTSIDENWVGEGKRITQQMRGGRENENRFRLNETGRAVGETQEGRCKLKVIKK